MAEAAFTLEILTARRRVFSGEVVSLVAPGETGYLGVLARHAPLVTTLSPGRIIFRDPAGSTRTLHSTASGFLEVRENRATILADDVAD